MGRPTIAPELPLGARRPGGAGDRTAYADVRWRRSSGGVGHGAAGYSDGVFGHQLRRSSRTRFRNVYGAAHTRGRTIGYQLVFWKQATDYDVPPSTVYQALMDERTVDGLVTLPIATILSDLLDALPGSVRESDGGFEWIYWVSEDQQSSVQIEWSDEYVLADCRYVEYDVVNRIIDLLARFDCPLYDPQVDRRFDSAS